MKIDSYSFGKIVINGKEYRNDVIIFPEKVKANWWRKEGHSLHLEDIEEVLETFPEILVIGQGYSGMMEVPSEIENKLKEKGIGLKIAETKKAVKIYNDLADEGKKVIAALHLTC